MTNDVVGRDSIMEISSFEIAIECENKDDI